MKNGTGRECLSEGGIDARILTHLLRETTALLEESQTHAIIEAETSDSTAALAKANWRLSTTAAWALHQLNGEWGDGSEGVRLLAPAPSSGTMRRGSVRVSPTLSRFLQSVDRLHERACRLEELSGAPSVRSTDLDVGGPPQDEGARERVINLFGAGEPSGARENHVLRAQKRLNWLLSAT